MKYYMIDTRDGSNHYTNKTYTIEELKEYFRLDKEEFPEEHEKLNEVQDIEDLKEYLKWEYSGYEVPYKFVESEN